uniref:Fuz_longin_1 domain-containing protein n=1 Tax=Angiostrongylus cantonensis TaxID=6313 RepID=A0A0K0D6K1_ANGCA
LIVDRDVSNTWRTYDATNHDKIVFDRIASNSSALMSLANAASSLATGSPSSPLSENDSDPDSSSARFDPRSYPWFYMTDEVIEAATLCLVAQAEESSAFNPCPPHKNVFYILHSCRVYDLYVSHAMGVVYLYLHQGLFQLSGCSGEVNDVIVEEMERMVLGEFGRCLQEIISNSSET